MSRHPVNVGLVGAGRIGRIHAENLATRIPEARLVSVADVDIQSAQEVGTQFNVPKIVEEYRETLEDPEIDAVAICSSTDTHAQIIQEAALAGKHIFCEKPIDHDLNRIDQALAAVERADVKLQVGFNRRFDPNFRRIREGVAAGQVGVPHILHITSRDPEPPPLEYVKVSGGIFLDMTIHDFDMARYLIGSEVEEIYVLGAVRITPEIRDLEDLDTVIITLRFENGTLGTINNSRQAVYGYDQRVEVFGSEGMIAARNETPDQHTLTNAEGIHRPLPLHFFLERYAQSYINEMQSFVDCIQEEKPPEVTGIDGRIPVVMALAASKAYAENRPVRLSEIN